MFCLINFASSLLLMLAIGGVEGCTQQQKINAVLSSVKFVPPSRSPATAYVRCWNGKKMERPLCRVEQCNATKYNEIRFPAELIWGRLRDCQLFEAYHICKAADSNDYTCLQDYHDCDVPQNAWDSNKVYLEDWTTNETALAVCQRNLPEWVRCFDRSSANKVTCRLLSCLANELKLDSQVAKFASKSVCEANLYAARPCYVPTMATGNDEKAYSIVAAWDFEGGQCPGGSLMLSSTYIFGKSRTETLNSVIDYYRDDLTLTHFRCQQGASKPVCRPNMGTPSMCPAGEVRLQASQPISWATLADCEDQRYFALMCYPFDDTTSSFSCHLDTDFNGCPPNSQNVASTFFDDNEGSKALDNCRNTTSDDVRWLRCRNANANPICRPLAVGCIAPEVALAPSAGLSHDDCVNFATYRVYYNDTAKPTATNPSAAFSCLVDPQPGVSNLIGPVFYDELSCDAYAPDEWMACQNGADITCRPAVGTINCLTNENRIYPIGALTFANLNDCLAATPPP